MPAEICEFTVNSLIEEFSKRYKEYYRRKKYFKKIPEIKRKNHR